MCRKAKLERFCLMFHFISTRDAWAKNKDAKISTTKTNNNENLNPHKKATNERRKWKQKHVANRGEHAGRNKNDVITVMFKEYLPFAVFVASAVCSVFWLCPCKTLIMIISHIFALLSPYFRPANFEFCISGVRCAKRCNYHSIECREILPTLICCTLSISTLYFGTFLFQFLIEIPIHK